MKWNQSVMLPMLTVAGLGLCVTYIVRCDKRQDFMQTTGEVVAGKDLCDVAEVREERDMRVCTLSRTEVVCDGSSVKQPKDRLQKRDDVARLGSESGFEPQQESQAQAVTALQEQDYAASKAERQFEQGPAQDREEQERERKRRIRDMYLLFLPIPVIITRMKKKQDKNDFDLQEGGNDKMMNNNGGGNEFNMALMALLYMGSVPMFGPSAPLSPVNETAQTADVPMVAAEACCGSAETEALKSDVALDVKTVEKTVIAGPVAAQQSDAPKKTSGRASDCSTVDTVCSATEYLMEEESPHEVECTVELTSFGDLTLALQRANNTSIDNLSSVEYVVRKSYDIIHFGADKTVKIMNKDGTVTTVAKSKIMQELTKRLGYRTLWSPGDGVGLIIDPTGRFIVVQAIKSSTSGRSLHIVQAELLTTYNSLKSGAITIDKAGKLTPGENCTLTTQELAGIQLLTPSHGKYSFDFMNPKATAGKCYACGK